LPECVGSKQLLSRIFLEKCTNKWTNAGVSESHCFDVKIHERDHTQEEARIPLWANSLRNSERVANTNCGTLSTPAPCSLPWQFALTQIETWHAHIHKPWTLLHLFELTLQSQMLWRMERIFVDSNAWIKSRSEYCSTKAHDGFDQLTLAFVWVGFVH
jgi:hypothetical protein